jgi:hypothetical protein
MRVFPSLEILSLNRLGMNNLPPARVKVSVITPTKNRLRLLYETMGLIEAACLILTLAQMKCFHECLFRRCSNYQAAL